MHQGSRIARYVGLTGIVLLVACGDDPPLPGPGTLTATLVGPNAAEGAAVVQLFGEGIQSISAVSPTQAFPRLDANGARVVLVNHDGGTLAFELALTDTLQKPEILVIEVAGPDDELRADVTSYDVELVR